jgi:hypothetical protein
MRNYILATFLLTTSTAMAQSQSLTRQSNSFGGKDELSPHMGFQAGLGGTTPGGFKLFFDYSHRLTNLVWLNFKLNPTFGVGAGTGVCYDRFGNGYDCGGLYFDGNGYAIDLLAGIKLKWMTRVHVMPYANIDGGVIPIFARPAGDNGAAIAFHTGGGVKYFVTPKIGVGGEIDFTLGPAFYSGHTELYRAFNLAIGAEFLL